MLEKFKNQKKTIEAVLNLAIQLIFEQNMVARVDKVVVKVVNRKFQIVFGYFIVLKWLNLNKFAPLSSTLHETFIQNLPTGFSVVPKNIQFLSYFQTLQFFSLVFNTIIATFSKKINFLGLFTKEVIYFHFG